MHGKPKVTLWKRKIEIKSWKEADRASNKGNSSVIRSVENKWIRNKKGSTACRVLGVWNTTCVF